MKLIGFLLLLLTISNTRQACAQGCLKCDASSNCIVADLSQGYVLSNNAVTKVTLANCTTIGSATACAVCNAGYFLDSTTGKCVIVPAASAVTNCSFYSSATACSVCATGYYLNNNLCQQATPAITNCKYYSSATQCDVCADNFIPSLDSTTCVAVSAAANCSGYSYVGCNACASGYHVNRNSYLSDYLNHDLTTDNGVLALWAQNLIKDRSEADLEACVSNTNTYCSTFAGESDNCTVCNNGYFLSNGVCTVFPSEPILNCATYSNASTCSSCVVGYGLSGNACVSATASVGCATYNTSVSPPVCLTCLANYYYTASNNSCTLRSNGTIGNCTTLSLTADACAVCAANFFVGTPATACIPAIAHCAVHANTASGAVAQCTTCASGYYLVAAANSTTSNSCAQGSVTNCAVYPSSNADGTVCTTCASGFYLVTSSSSVTTCVAQPTITNCSTYSTTVANTCLACNAANSFNVILKQTCQNVTGTITGCATYASGTLAAPVCATCNAGLTLNSAGTTCTTTTITNCVKSGATANVCAVCAPNFAVGVNGASCVATFAYISNQCLETNLPKTAAGTQVGVLLSKCNICATGAVPYILSGNNVCLSYAETAQFNNGTALTATGIASSNCIKYNSSLNCTQCDPASTNKYLTIGVPSTCGPSCSGAIAVYTLASNNVASYNVCYTPTSTAAPADANCAVYAPVITPLNASNGTNGDLTKQGCIQCASGYANVITVSNTGNYSNVRFDATVVATATQYTSLFEAPYAKYSIVSCVQNNSVTGIGSVARSASASEIIPNCRYYVATSGVSNDYSCAKCVHGYFGTLNANGYVNACSNASPNNTCDATVRYANFDTVIAQLSSCHACTDRTTIPIIAYKSTSSTNPTFVSFANYSYNANTTSNTFASSTVDQPNIVCRNPTTLPTNVNQADWGINNNCAVGAIAINTNGVYSTGGTVSYGSYCAACKPGYYNSTPNATYPWVKTCVAITGCTPTTANGDLVNGCINCNNTYIHAFTGSSVDYTKCLTLPTNTAPVANCYAALYTTGTTVATTCVVCNPGYSINYDGYCEQLTTVNCATNSFRLAINNSSASLNWALFTAGNTPGCNRCNTGFVSVALSSSSPVGNNVCLTSSFSTSVASTIVNNYYISNCKNYSTLDPTDNTCLACNSDYIIDGEVDGSIAGYNCYPTANVAAFANCAVALNSSKCAACKDATYSLKPDGTCALGVLANCAAFQYTNQYSSSAPNNNTNVVNTCTRCSPGFYLSGNTCLASPITNCADHGTASNTCVTCATGYTLINTPSPLNDVCAPNPASLNCSQITYVVNGSNGIELTCNSCTNASTQIPVAVTSTQPQNFCLVYSLVNNCSTYKIGSDASATDFTCLTCAAGFYLSNFKCVTRVNQPAKCATYNATQDKCSVCDSTSFVSADGTVCVNNPSGIVGCSTYSNATTCTACGTRRYLSNNTCVYVTTPIDNCVTYSNATTCTSCAANFALVSNVCKTATATNCASYASDIACATCPAGYALGTAAANGARNCEQVTKTGCATIDGTTGNCTSCNSGYYLSNNACVAATTIAHCQAYDSATTCTRCDATYALNADRTGCVTSTLITSSVADNCINNTLSATPICSRCGPGRYFVNGACTGTCSVTGCLACNPSNNSVCYICNTGYYQDATGKCNAVDSGAEKSASIFGVFSAVLLVITVMFK